MMASLFLMLFAVMLAAKDHLYCNSSPKPSSKKYKNAEMMNLNEESDAFYESSNAKSFLSYEFEDENFENLNTIPLPRGLSLVIINERMNFSDAVEYCSSDHIKGKLLTTNNEIEEKFVMEYLKQNKTAHVCDKLFIGYRNIIDKLFLTPDGILFYPSTEISSQVSDFFLHFNKLCGKLVLKGSLKIEAIPCDVQSICFVCDVLDEKCGGRFLCQRIVNVLWPPISFTAANKYCKEFVSNSAGLALLANDHVSPVLRNTFLYMASQQLVANYDCLVLRTNLSKLYETWDGTEMLYKSRKIYIDNYKDHCLVVNKNRNFQWTSESCSNLNCFVCRIDKIVH